MRGAQPIHGHARNGANTSTYSSWRCMKNRCLRPEHRKYEFYGGRGITICPEWLGTRKGEGFSNFLRDMGPRPDGCTLDRIEANKNYEPSNCCWATKAEQMAHSRRIKMVTLNGVTMTQGQWSTQMFGDKGFVSRRLYKGWSMEEAILTPRLQ